ncbi:MAG: hypothetical protein LQ344_003120 [Seirophora lacunosa]|nr:MAG: hypothetical protein LQ344_003120 [Seirophora lacunosa]
MPHCHYSSPTCFPSADDHGNGQIDGGTTKGFLDENNLSGKVDGLLPGRSLCTGHAVLDKKLDHAATVPHQTWPTVTLTMDHRENTPHDACMPEDRTDPDPSLHPAVTTVLDPHAGGIEQAGLTDPGAPPADVRFHPPAEHQRGASPASSPQAHGVPSPKTPPTAAQIARRQQLSEQNLAFLEHIARTTVAGEDSDGATENTADSDADSHSSRPDMATEAAIREELAKNFMFVDRGHLTDPGNIAFKETVMKVMKSDRVSVVSEQEIKNFQKYYQAYKLANESTFTHLLIPMMMKPEFTAQEVNEDGQPSGEFLTRDFVDQGVITSVDRQFRHRYCLPHRLMNSPQVPWSTVQEHFDKSNALTTPKPDFAFGLREDKLPPAPWDITVSEATDSLLKVAPTRETFLVWENTSGHGIGIKRENHALRDASAVIYAKRQLYQRLGRCDTPGIDKQTYVYAATNDNRTLDVWVVYAWLPGDLSRVEFHMERIGSIDFIMTELEADSNILANTRKPLHNIIQWGSLTRIPELEAFYRQLWDSQRERFTRSLEKAREAEAEAEAEGSSRKKPKTQ